MSDKNKESLLWQKVKKGLTDCFLTRIESSTINGIPDIHGVNKVGVFWVELKSDDSRVRPSRRDVLNCTDRCPCLPILVHLNLVPRSRSRITGQRSSNSW
jgi:hypothetical protein